MKVLGIYQKRLRDQFDYSIGNFIAREDPTTGFELWVTEWDFLKINGYGFIGKTGGVEAICRVDPQFI
jgi:hypothetical protein